MPKVSVILTSFNHAKYIRDAIDSVLNQSFEDFELIIWDDASVDESWDIILSYTDSRIKAFRNSEQRRGIFGINKAINEIARGEFIAIHHSDDIWERSKLEAQVAFLSSNKDIGAVFCNASAINESGDRFDDPEHFYSNIFLQENRSRYEWLRLFFGGRNVLCHSSVLVRRSCYEVCGLYRFGFAQICDLEMWVRLCFKYEIHVLAEELVKFRVRDNEANSSGNRPEVRIRSLYEFYKLLANYREVDSFDELVKIFPSAVDYIRDGGSDTQFALAMIAIKGEAVGANELFGLSLLFDIISDPARALVVRQIYGFDYRDYVMLTGQHDIFYRERVSSVLNDVSRCQDAFGALSEQNHKLSIELEKLRNSPSWRLTAPLRWLSQRISF